MKKPSPDGLAGARPEAYGGEFGNAPGANVKALQSMLGTFGRL